jgi:alpha-D-ribose 1-methylphosphonate 5-triphosphate synthase subunit PhnH
MENNKLIPAIYFCNVHYVELKLFQTVSDKGLVEIIEQDETVFIQEHQVKKLKQILAFHNDSDLNLEATDEVFAWLNRKETMQTRIDKLGTKLERFT